MSKKKQVSKQNEVQSREKGIIESGNVYPKASFFNAKNFKIVSLITLVLMVALSFDFGINGDEKFQVDYSKKLWTYYSTLGKDTSALNVPETNMQWYGGLFELTAISLDKAMGMNDEFTPRYHYIRRVLCACFGFIAIFFTSLFAQRIGGWPLAFLTFGLLLISPRFLGDTMVNPKDIPFAAGYIMGLYFISRFIRELPKPGFISMIGVILGVMIALNTRAAGLLLIVYLILFAAISVLGKHTRNELTGKQDLWSSALFTIAVALFSYGAGILFWPYALSNPILHPIKALSELTNQPIAITVLFSGYHFVSLNLPWNYLLEWIIRTIPLFSIFGLLFFIRLFRPRFKDLPALDTYLLIFSFIFPITYAMLKHSSLHDGWRHFIFIYPPFVLIASLGWLLWFTSFRSKAFRVVSIILLIIMLSENIYSIIALHPFQYTYFSPLLGGLKKAYGNFETDYWMLSVKEAAAWLKYHEKIDRDNKSHTIATNCMYPAQVYLSDTSGRIHVKYSRYYERSASDWDYAIFYSRFVDRNQLYNHTWPPKGTIHTIDADGIPLCAIIKRENKEDLLGYEALKKNNMQAAIQHFKSALEYAPLNESVSMELADLYRNNCQFEEAERAVQQSLKAYPGNPIAINLLKTIQTERKNFQ